MKKLVDREERAKRDPRENARRKRAISRGEDYDELSDDVDSDDDEIHIAGAVNPMDIAADAKRKRQSKAERLESILAGRQKFKPRLAPEEAPISRIRERRISKCRNTRTKRDTNAVGRITSSEPKEEKRFDERSAEERHNFLLGPFEKTSANSLLTPVQVAIACE
jgi:protein SDA1